MLAGSAEARRWVGFQFADHQGTPPTTLAYEPVSGQDASSTAPGEAIAPADGDAANDDAVIRLAVAGDVGTGDAAAFATGRVADEIEGAHGDYDALLLLGDNIYDDGDPARVDPAVFEPFGPVLDGDTKLLAALGNHDVDDGWGDARSRSWARADVARGGGVHFDRWQGTLRTAPPS